ncbi:MAG: biotin/lipoyl-containing protein, partial [Jatrophihabitantaceae bacterium]
MPDFLLPDLGEGLSEAQVVTWHVRVGDEVHVDQVVVEVETAKAAVEVPIPFAGKVSALHAEPGQSLAVGMPLISVSEVATGFREPGVVTAADETSGNVLIGYGTSAPGRRRRAGRRRPAELHAVPEAGAVPETTPVADAARVAGPVAVISPLVRKMARDAEVD